MNAITVSNLSKTYAPDIKALKSINLTIAEGDFFALLGANGAGKTTLIGILTGLVIKSGGSVDICGFDIDHHHQQGKSLLGVVPQEFNFNQFERVMDILLNQSGYYGLTRDQAYSEAEDLLKRLELWQKRDLPARQLSGGMKRRLMIARALVHQPKILILDEPTAGVDVELRHSMWVFLKGLNQKGTTILLTTHYLEEVEQLCQNAAIIKNGRIIMNDSVRNLMQLVESEDYIVHVDHVSSLEPFKRHQPRQIDQETFEVTLKKTESLSNFISLLTQHQMEIKDLRPKANRIERLFLEILKKDSQ